MSRTHRSPSEDVTIARRELERRGYRMETNFDTNQVFLMKKDRELTDAELIAQLRAHYGDRLKVIE